MARLDGGIGDCREHILALKRREVRDDLLDGCAMREQLE
jgi:hypothetical protein